MSSLTADCQLITFSLFNPPLGCWFLTSTPLHRHKMAACFLTEPSYATLTPLPYLQVLVLRTRVWTPPVAKGAAPALSSALTQPSTKARRASCHSAGSLSGGLLLCMHQRARMACAQVSALETVQQLLECLIAYHCIVVAPDQAMIHVLNAMSRAPYRSSCVCSHTGTMA